MVICKSQCYNYIVNEMKHIPNRFYKVEKQAAIRDGGAILPDVF